MIDLPRGFRIPLLHYVHGDATAPAGRPALIVHICNDEGKWGSSGFVLAATRRWPEPEACYRIWHAKSAREAISSYRAGIARGVRSEETGAFGLGESQLVEVEPGALYVLNMVAQEGVSMIASPRVAARVPAVRYAALALCLRHADRFACSLGASIHMPRIGCGLGGGTWKEVGALVKRLVSVDVTVYDLPLETLKE